ncbi:TrkA C-terminal domain-containing protein [Chloroflexi bacterium TSY]|nr:TrkA C-terminal domain-containing protein [Chloroflexi bacterium TSY]
MLTKSKVEQNKQWQASCEILPGFSVGRIVVQRSWAGKSLIDLNLCARYDVNVIDLIEPSPHGNRVHPKIDITRPLQKGKILIVLGEDEKVNAIQAYVLDEQMPD